MAVAPYPFAVLSKMQPCQLDLSALIPSVARAKNGTSLNFPAVPLIAKRNKPLSWERDESMLAFAKLVHWMGTDTNKQSHKFFELNDICPPSVSLHFFFILCVEPSLFSRSSQKIKAVVFFKVPSVMWYVTCMTHYGAFTVDGTFKKGN